MSILLPRLEHAWNVFPKAKDSIPESPAVYARRFFYDALVFDAAAIRFLAASFGAAQLLVGSDYPFALGEPDPVGRLGATGLDADTVAAIQSRNALRFLGLDGGRA
jgi:aminocarboxymuconate-semialdehyde decarboxylase